MHSKIKPAQKETQSSVPQDNKQVDLTKMTGPQAVNYLQSNGIHIMPVMSL